ncbi:hypothetical protein PVAG01_04358 [Phlyctema vagabunda]|uniref:Uncharacterized protein n=1 Tax=Phlyctema vagabunda TaxID=108571 RepID=A0ABR4PPP8_9HELO
MASQTSSDRATAQQQPLFSFLTLAPTTSAGYPTSPSSSAASIKSRRSSSSSSASSATGPRFLKLGPVHFGEGVDGESDWSEISVTE